MLIPTHPADRVSSGGKRPIGGDPNGWGPNWHWRERSRDAFIWLWSVDSGVWTLDLECALGMSPSSTWAPLEPCIPAAGSGSARDQSESAASAPASISENRWALVRQNSFPSLDRPHSFINSSISCDRAHRSHDEYELNLHLLHLPCSRGICL